jgi:hypothetical protein
LPDLTQGATTIKRKLRFMGFTYDPYARNGVTLNLRVQAVLFAADAAGGYGAELAGEQFNQLPRSLQADRHTLVDATGVILLVRTGETDVQWQAKQDELAATQDVWLQADLFEYLRDNSPLSIPALVEQYMRVAIASGYWT